MTNWISQVSVVTLFNLRTIPERLGASITAIIGIAGVVAVFVGVLSIAEGFKAAMKPSSPADVALVLRAGSDSEMNSGLSREETRLISDAPGIARNGDAPLTSAELFVVINLPVHGAGDANVPLRGVDAAALTVRGNMKIVEGRMFQTGHNEVIVGAGAARAFGGMKVSDKIHVGPNDWEIVGMFTGGSGSAESEIWADAAVLQQVYHRGDTFQSVYARLESPESFQAFHDYLTTNPQLKVKPVLQSEFLADQSVMLSKFIQGVGVFVAALMAVGALFGALNTMFSSVSARTREISTLRALGFGASPIVISVVLESLILALVGGAIGGAVAYFGFNGYQASTINWQTFSQVAFSFAVTPALLVSAIIWAAMIGLLGGIFPAIRAARIPIASGLRET